MVGWLVGWLVGLLVGLVWSGLVGWLVGLVWSGLVGWLVGLIGWPDWPGLVESVFDICWSIYIHMLDVPRVAYLE